MFERILVALDGSRHSKRAVEGAIELAREHGSSVHLLHAIRDLALPPEILEMIRAGEITKSRQEILEDSARIILEQAKERFEEAGISGVQMEYAIGDPACVVADYAEKQGMDLIVIGYRGLGTRGDFLGSMARKLLNITRVSCLVVRDQKAEVPRA